MLRWGFSDDRSQAVGNSLHSGFRGAEEIWRPQALKQLEWVGFRPSPVHGFHVSGSPLKDVFLCGGGRRAERLCAAEYPRVWREKVQSWGGVYLPSPAARHKIGASSNPGGNGSRRGAVNSRATFFVQECPVCGRRLQVRIEFLGKVVACPHCHGQVVGSDPAMRNQGEPGGLDLLGKANQLLASADASVPRTT